MGALLLAGEPQVAEGVARAEKQALDGGSGGAQVVGNLVVRLVAEVAQDQDRLALPEAEQDGRLQAMAEGKDLERQAISALKVFASFFYYCDERTWASIHYQGPLVQTASAPEADSRVAPRPG